MLPVQATQAYDRAMLRRFSRQFVFLATLVAFLCAGVTQAMPSATMLAPPEAAMTMPMIMETADDGTAIPCKDLAPCQDRMPGCMLDLGCVFMIGLPMPDPPAVTRLDWSAIFYWMSDVDPAGLTRKPALDPPISRV